MSKPSNTTYTVTMTAMIMNQRVGMLLQLRRAKLTGLGLCRGSHGSRSALNFAVYQEKKEEREHGVHSGATEDREPPVTGRHHLGEDFCGAHQPINQPGLASHFRGDPAGSVGDVRQREREH